MDDTSIIVLCVITIITTVSADYHVTFYLKEEVPASSLVGNVATSSALITNLTTEEFSQLQYNFLDQNNYQSLFTVNSDNGNLFTSVVIDRESVCPSPDVCSLRFDVAAHSSFGSKFIIISVDVILQDINDNAPAFHFSTITRQISESAIIGSPIIVDEATDLDSTLVNRILTYSMVPNSSPFSFSFSKNGDGGFDLRLVLTLDLDRELVDSYDVLIIAKDGGEKQKTGTLTVHIEVTDFNDNSPIFAERVYNVSIPENAAIGSTVVKVTAHDEDIGDNGAIIYRLKPRQANLDKIRELFTIDGNTGRILVYGNLGYESGKVYEIEIEALDKGQKPRTGHTLARVTVLDVINNAPQVKVNFLLPHNSEQVNISEASNVGTVIAHVNVEDTDSGPNGNVSCRISSGVFDLQIVQGKGYIIVVEREVDREEKNIHNISVTCSDKGTPNLSATENFLVKVIDFNDNEPEFYQTLYHGSIAENGEIGDVITQVRAWDRDLGNNANLTYAVDGKDTDKFAINPYTGVVTTNVAFDRELRSNYLFHVKAIDQGSPPLTGTTSVTLTILDQNDNKPTFDVPMFQFFVLENLSSDVKVGTLSATDADEGDNSKILYEMHNNYKNRVPFQVFPDGTIQTTQTLDREFQSNYEFHINAVDQGSVKQTSSTAVKVYVADDNDNRPVITFPGKGNETAFVSYLAQIGTVVAQVRAYDLDEHGPNNQLRYTIIGGNTHDVFSIGENSGKIYLKRTHEIKMDTTYRIQINVSDMNVVKTLYKVKTMNIVLKYSNSTSSLPLTESGSKNVLIVVGFVAFTAILSIVIITVICILRRNDVKKNNFKTKDHEKTMYSAPPEVVKSDPYSLQLAKDNSVELPKKKKEVSFSIDDDSDVFESAHHLPSVTENCSHLGNEHINADQKRLDTDSQRSSLSLHHMLLDFKSLNTDLQRARKPVPPGDNLSDSSGEITNSDSGRGGSDLDLFNNSSRALDDRRKHPVKFNVDIGSRKYKHGADDLAKSPEYRLFHSSSVPCDNDVIRPKGEGWVPSYV